MTLRQFIENLERIASEEGEQIEIVTPNQEGPGTFEPEASVVMDKDGVRRVYI